MQTKCSFQKCFYTCLIYVVPNTDESWSNVAQRKSYAHADFKKIRGNIGQNSRGPDKTRSLLLSELFSRFSPFVCLAMGGRGVRRWSMNLFHVTESVPSSCNFPRQSCR